MRRICLISTGGTIEKTYDEHTGRLENRHSVVQRMLRRLRLEDTQVTGVELMSKDSQEFTDADRRRIVDAVRLLGGEPGGVPAEARGCDGVVVLHGTDTLSITGELLHREFFGGDGEGFRVPIVLTGAMRPFEMKASDALQNLNEALFACGVLGAGVYCVFHGRSLRFPGVVKDRERGTFVMEAARTS